MVVATIMVINFGCEPVGIDPPPSDFDKMALLNGYVVPDTVAVNESFAVQISFKTACNDVFLTVRRDTSGHRLTYTPLVHEYPDQNCNSPATDKTVVDSVKFIGTGIDTLLFNGSQALSIKTIVAQSTIVHPSGFSFHFLFTDSLGGIPLYPTTFQRLDGSAARTIHADQFGYWDTTFIDTLQKIKYKISSSSFEAQKGVVESGVILIQ